MKSAEIREAFLSFFEAHGHTRVPSSSLVPASDPTLLFTNAGMVPFKDVFLGREHRPYQRAASAQRCVRAGGKHNDLENVGYTARHHTFFEMLGNFSFGDYFKREAIGFAWEFLTDTLGLSPEKLWVTVHVSDDEAADIWLKEIGVAPERFSRLDEDNFWQMGDTGPCGPSAEIFYDHGPEVAGGPPGSPEADGDRYIEIWNLVFMQYERDADGTLTPLPNPSIDTGMGLERIAAVMQGVHSNYDIDLFQDLLAAAAKAVGCANEGQASLRVLADHIRSCAFLIADGVLPSNEGRGYVLRRIIRRAVRHGYQLGADDVFFYRLAVSLAAAMGNAYPELREQQQAIERVLKAEEEQFALTLEQGMRLLEEAIDGLSGDTLPGESVFKLYDTYGFPVDLTADVARERGLHVDVDGFEQAMAAQRARARNASRFEADYAISVDAVTEFTGYDTLTDEAIVVALFRDGEAVEQLATDESGVVVLDRTPFYAESGGQVGDAGVLHSEGHRFEVRDTTKSGDSHLHHGVVVAGALAVGDRLTAAVDPGIRQATVLNHSATHLLHAALREILGEHVTQKGSLVNSERLRFDFSHFEPITREQLRAIEHRVNEQIRRNTPARIEITDPDTARDKGALALFGEKYGDEVRVLTLGDGFSVELCGGTHVERTGDIGVMRIVSEAGVASGVRRIEAVTGEAALAWSEAQEDQLDAIAQVIKGHRDQLAGKVRQLVQEEKALEKEVERLKAKLASAAGGDLSSQARDVAGITVLAAEVPGGDAKSLRTTLDQLKDKLGSAIILLGAREDSKVTLIAGVTGDLTDRFKAGDLIRELAPKVGGKGGGRPDMAQGGGSDPDGLPNALAAVEAWVREHAAAA